MIPAAARKKGGERVQGSKRVACTVQPEIKSHSREHRTQTLRGEDHRLLYLCINEVLFVF